MLLPEWAWRSGDVALGVAETSPHIHTELGGSTQTLTANQCPFSAGWTRLSFICWVDKIVLNYPCDKFDAPYCHTFSHLISQVLLFHTKHSSIYCWWRWRKNNNLVTFLQWRWRIYGFLMLPVNTSHPNQNYFHRRHLHFPCTPCTTWYISTKQGPGPKHFTFLKWTWCITRELSNSTI